jgi:hypothetical protein
VESATLVAFSVAEPLPLVGGVYTAVLPEGVRPPMPDSDQVTPVLVEPETDAVKVCVPLPAWSVAEVGEIPTVTPLLVVVVTVIVRLADA